MALRRYALGDHLGSTKLEVDADGKVIAYEEFHPYGTTSYRAMRTSLDAAANRYRYTGMERDEETGLAQHGARYYAAWLGRWTSADPTGLGDGVNRFAYCRGSPVMLSDRSGHAGQSPQTPDTTDAEWILESLRSTDAATPTADELARQRAMTHSPAATSRSQVIGQWHAQAIEAEGKRSLALAAARNEGLVPTSPEAHAAARVFFGLASAVPLGGPLLRALILANAADEIVTGISQYAHPSNVSLKAWLGGRTAEGFGASPHAADAVARVVEVAVPLTLIVGGAYSGLRRAPSPAAVAEPLPSVPGIPEVGSVAELPGLRPGFRRVYRGTGHPEVPQVSRAHRSDPTAAPSGASEFLSDCEAYLHAHGHVGGRVGHPDGLSVSEKFASAKGYKQDGAVVVYDVPVEVFEQLPRGDHGLYELVFKHSIPEEFRTAIVRK